MAASIRLTRVRYSLDDRILMEFSPGMFIKFGSPAPEATNMPLNPSSSSCSTLNVLPMMQSLINFTPCLLYTSLHQLNDTGCCEFLAEPYSHGLSSLANEDCFKEEVMRQSAKMKQMFGKAPKVFRNSSLIYNDEIGAMVASMGFKGMLTEGAKHVLGMGCRSNQRLPAGFFR